MPRKDNVVLTELRRFCDLTSAKGVGRALKSETSCLKLTWIVAVVFLLGVTVFNVWNLTTEYMMFHTGTKITERKIDIVQDKATDVMLCNVNPYSTSFLNATTEKWDLYQELITEWTTVSGTESREEIRLLNNIRQEMLTGQSGFFQYLGHKEASSLSHSWRNFVISCQVNFLDGVMEKSVPCSFVSMKVAKYQHKEYFNCYKIFGSGGGGGNGRPTTGMSFLLYLDDSQESDTLLAKAKGRGAVLTIGDTGTFLNPDTDGVEILPNYVTTIKFELTNRERLSKPHGECIDRKNQQGTNVDKGKLNLANTPYSLPYVYTEEACLSACIEYNIIQTCQCQDVGQYGILTDVFKNVSMCGATDQGRDILKQRIQCVQRWRSEFRKQCLPKCPSPCQEKLVDTSTTYLDLTQRQVTEKLKEERQISSVPVLDEEIPGDLIDYGNFNISNFAWVHLKRKRTSYFLVEDTEAMTISDWLAKVGGAMNLWSGITVFVFVEVLDLLCRLIKRTFSSELENGSTNRTQGQGQNQGHCPCYCHLDRNYADIMDKYIPDKPMYTDVSTAYSLPQNNADRYTADYGNINSAFH